MKTRDQAARARRAWLSTTRARMEDDMSQYFFGLHDGHLKAIAWKIAKKHGAEHVNFTEPNGRERGWFVGPNRGEPFDSRLKTAVLADIDRAGGIESLRVSPHRRA